MGFESLRQGINIVGVGGVFGLLELVSLCVAFELDFFSAASPELAHLVEDDLIDFDVVGAEAVVDEAWGEVHSQHAHVVLRLVLVVEFRVTYILESCHVEDE